MTDLADLGVPNTRAGEIVRGTRRLLGGLVKSSIADFRADSKWPEYLPYCDQLYFAVANDFPHDLIPDETGLIVADAFGGAVVRAAPEDKLSAARRKAVTLRLARLAAMRLTQSADTGWTAAPGLLT